MKAGSHRDDNLDNLRPQSRDDESANEEANSSKTASRKAWRLPAARASTSTLASPGELEDALLS